MKKSKAVLITRYLPMVQGKAEGIPREERGNIGGVREGPNLFYWESSGACGKARYVF